MQIQMSIAELRREAKMLREIATAIENNKKQVENGVFGLEGRWTGVGAEEFFTKYTGEWGPTIEKVIGQIRAAAAELEAIAKRMEEAENQAKASLRSLSI
ncbi:MAG: WXG100 family type VII secretion target [Anaerolineaceae bacterium]|jgi:WXG100 family type VII secretion target|nr:WXG100 family type VII secretion target [Anaerolineaceae bacterium]